MVRWATHIKVRIYRCETISKSTMLFKKRERINRLQFRLNKLEESKRRLRRLNERKKIRRKKTFLCCSVKN